MIRPNDDLAKLLEHPDMRVRQEAQFALADKGAEVVPLLAKIAKRQAKDTGERLARFHALWALGQIARRNHEESTVPAIIACAVDHDSEARARPQMCLAT